MKQKRYKIDIIIRNFEEKKMNCYEFLIQCYDYLSYINCFYNNYKTYYLVDEFITNYLKNYNDIKNYLYNTIYYSSKKLIIIYKFYFKLIEKNNFNKIKKKTIFINVVENNCFECKFYKDNIFCEYFNKNIYKKNCKQFEQK